MVLDRQLTSRFAALGHVEYADREFLEFRGPKEELNEYIRMDKDGKITGVTHATYISRQNKK